MRDLNHEMPIYDHEMSNGINEMRNYKSEMKNDIHEMANKTEAMAALSFRKASILSMISIIICLRCNKL